MAAARVSQGAQHNPAPVAGREEPELHQRIVRVGEDAQRDSGASAALILGVLRTPAAPLSASVLTQLERPLDRSNGTEIYTNFIRRARFFEGQPYYIAAIRFDGCVIKPSGDNILLVGDGEGEIGGTAQRIEAGKYVGTGGPGIAGNPHSGTVEMVVPDGVATATMHYPAGPANGFTPKIISPPVTVTATVIGNVLTLQRAPRSSGGGQITHPTSTYLAQRRRSHHPHLPRAPLTEQSLPVCANRDRSGRGSARMLAASGRGGLAGTRPPR